MPNSPMMSPIDSRVEMFQKGHPKDAFFNMKALAPRPISEATVMFDTEFDGEDSETEESSPRLSLGSTGRRSETTLSSYEEIQTPSPTKHEFEGFSFEIVSKNKSTEGPRGPHLFRSSVDSAFIQDEYTLGMSPMTPKPSTLQRMEISLNAPRVPEIPVQHRPFVSLNYAVEEPNLNEVALWTPQQVARWMYDAGFEPSIVERFEDNDISGAILTTLKFEDLRELDIPSFGQRTKVWNEIHTLRGGAPGSPRPPTPIEDSSPCTEFHHDDFHRGSSSSSRPGDCGIDDMPKRQESKRKHLMRNDVISPLESVSIVGIEQLMPKPHKCAKGENCSKWRKQQRLINNFNNDHPVSPEGGQIWIAGDPGNSLTAAPVDRAARPFSDAVPSVVASSDVLGPGTAPAFSHLEASSLRNLQSRDPQDNVKQFLQFQHMDPSQMAWSSEEPATPPFEMFPKLPTQHSGLRGLPKLAIPPPRPTPPARASSAMAFSPYRMERVEAVSSDLRNVAQTPSNTIYRFGTPFSETDVPVTAVNLGPISRDASQSVPPNMSYRNAGPPVSMPLIQRSQSRSSGRQRPSFAMPRVDENISTEPSTQAEIATQQPAQHQHSSSWASVKEPSMRTADDISHSGWMKKRKTKMLRHEWHEHHFTLTGTRLAMHKDERAIEVLEHIDVDDYAIACSALASSKLNAAFKAMNISRGNKDKKDEAAFSFQLIPAAIEKGVRLRKRESAMGNASDGAAKNKTHHFAVQSRDERIDWMRELMLAKALKQKSEGYEVVMNGNMI